MNYSKIARSCIGPGGAPYSRMHINQVLNRRASASRLLADQLLACGAITSRRQIRVSAFC